MSDDLKVFGTLEPSDFQALEALQSNSRNFVFEIGQLELKKVFLIQRVNETDRAMQKVFLEVRTKMGVPEGCECHIQEGKLIITREAPVETPAEPTTE